MKEEGLDLSQVRGWIANNKPDELKRTSMHRKEEWSNESQCVNEEKDDQNSNGGVVASSESVPSSSDLAALVAVQLQRLNNLPQKQDSDQ